MSLDAIRLPMVMSISPKPATWRPEPQLRCEAEDAARLRGWSLTRFVDFCVDSALRLAFLDGDNRELIFEIVVELGRPWTALDVLNRLVTEVRMQIRTGKLRPGFWAGQRKQLQLFESR